MEEWRSIPEYPDYEASSLGRVRSWKKNSRWKSEGFPRVLKPCRGSAGRLQLSLVTESGLTSKCVHSLVALAFLGPNPGGMHVCHGNGVKDDNRVENLRWDTPEANAEDYRVFCAKRRGEPHQMAEDPRTAGLIVCLKLAGMTFREIGLIMGISRQACHQKYQRWVVDSPPPRA